MKVYISGKISGLPVSEVQRNFSEAERHLEEIGHEPINPTKNDDHTKNWYEHMVADIEMLMGCEAIYLLDNWEDSKGARIEYRISVELGLEIINDYDIEAFNDIKLAVEYATGISFQTFSAPGNKRENYFARMIMSDLLKKREYKNNDIARMINRDRITLRHMSECFPDEISHNKEFRVLYEKVEKELTKCVSH